MNLGELLEVAKRELKVLTTVLNPDFRLEEAEYDHKGKVWNVVVSFLVENTNKRQLTGGLVVPGLNYDRIYKKLKINDQRVLVGLYMYEK